MHKECETVFEYKKLVGELSKCIAEKARSRENKMVSIVSIVAFSDPLFYNNLKPVNLRVEC